jgi:hypothetical protein
MTVTTTLAAAQEVAKLNPVGAATTMAASGYVGGLRMRQSQAVAASAGGALTVISEMYSGVATATVEESGMSEPVVEGEAGLRALVSHAAAFEDNPARSKRARKGEKSAIENKGR